MDTPPLSGLQVSLDRKEEQEGASQGGAVRGGGSRCPIACQGTHLPALRENPLWVRKAVGTARDTGLGLKKTQFQQTAVPLRSWLTLGKLIRLSEPQKQNKTNRTKSSAVGKGECDPEWKEPSTHMGAQ